MKNVKSEENSDWEIIWHFPAGLENHRICDDFTNARGILLRQDTFAWKWESCSGSTAEFIPERDGNGKKLVAITDF